MRRVVETGEQNPLDEMEDEDSLLGFIESKINHMKQFLRLGAEREVNFYELQRALTEYPNVYNSLIAMSNSARFEHSKAKKEFDSWYGEVYLEKRKELNKASDAKAKWLTSTELDMVVQSENREDFIQKSNHVLDLEHRHHFLKDLLEMWKNYQYVLSTLSSNIRAEVGMEGRLR